MVLGIHFCLLYWKLKKKKKISRALVKYLPFTVETIQAAKGSSQLNIYSLLKQNMKSCNAKRRR